MRPKLSGDHFANLLQQPRRLLAHVAVLDGTTAVLVNVPQRLYGKIAKDRHDGTRALLPAVGISVSPLASWPRVWASLSATYRLERSLL
jgi:hypothetical protein